MMDRTTTTETATTVNAATSADLPILAFFLGIGALVLAA